MSIIKYIPNVKNDRNIIIYNNKNQNKNQNQNILNKEHLSNWLYTSLNIYSVYAGNVYNPPYFNNLIIFKNNLKDDDLKMIMNMTIVNGNILLPNLYKSFFKKYVIHEDEKYILVNKKINLTYQFPKYRNLDFIIAGTMKGGTTAAITNFCKHPDISMVKEEIHYFDKKINFQKGLEWYRSHFNYSKKMVGDKAPDVMYQTSCLELLQITNPSVKIILFLRNPIDRAYSHWKMSRDLFRNQSSFEVCVENEIKNRWGENRTYEVSFWYHFVQRGLYYEQIESILRYFPRDNLHILITEKVKNDMDGEYQKVFKFLGLKEHHDNYVEEFSSKSKDTINTKSPLYKRLKKIYSKDVKSLEKFLGYKTGWW
jgi:hypothetical protein